MWNMTGFRRWINTFLITALVMALAYGRADETERPNPVREAALELTSNPDKTFVTLLEGGDTDLYTIQLPSIGNRFFRIDFRDKLPKGLGDEDLLTTSEVQFGRADRADLAVVRSAYIELRKHAEKEFYDLLSGGKYPMLLIDLDDAADMGNGDTPWREVVLDKLIYELGRKEGIIEEIHLLIDRGANGMAEFRDRVVTYGEDGVQVGLASSTIDNNYGDLMRRVKDVVGYYR
jgi:hypothetical protein